MFHIDLIELFLEVCDLLSLDENVRSLATGPPTGLVDHDPGVGQTVPHALGTSGEQETAHTTGLANTPGADGRQDVLHGVVDGQAGGDTASGRVDVHVDGLLGAL